MFTEVIKTLIGLALTFIVVIIPLAFAIKAIHKKDEEWLGK